MEAKDTVIKIAENLGHPARIDIEYAIACYRAGEKVVVDWIEEHDFHDTLLEKRFKKIDWEAKLKEWGFDV